MSDIEKVQEEFEKAAEKIVKEYNAIYAVLFVDVHGPSREELKNLITGVANKIVKEQGVILGYAKVDETIELGDMFSSNIEVHLLVYDLASLATLVLRYTPMSIDIILPETITLSASHLNDIFSAISSYEYNVKKYIVERVSTNEDKAKFLKEIEARKKLGESIIKNVENKGGNDD